MELGGIQRILTALDTRAACLTKLADEPSTDLGHLHQLISRTGGTVERLDGQMGPNMLLGPTDLQEAQMALDAAAAGPEFLVTQSGPGLLCGFGVSHETRRALQTASDRIGGVVRRYNAPSGRTSTETPGLL